MTERFSPATAARVSAFLKAEQKAPTPLLSLSKYAASIGVGAVYVKDESGRLGTKAFKVSGVAWAMSCWMAQEIGCDLSKVKGGFKELRSLWEQKFPGKPCTFCTCTDGNHGAAVSLAAKLLGQKAVVYMPKGSAHARVENVRRHGGSCTVTEMNYDDTVDFASATATANGWQLLQDTTLENYVEIPSLIMEGYCLMADEALSQIRNLGAAMDDVGGPGAVMPTHVFLQAGVGSMASAVLAYLVEAFQANPSARPKCVICEPRDAACMHASAMQADGAAVEVAADEYTMIAGLQCGVPSSIAWPILRTHVDGGYAWVADPIAANGMRAAAKHGYEAGECGGAALGLIARLMGPGPKAAAARASLGLDASSRVLLINTEGATDPVNYNAQLQLADVPWAEDDFHIAPPLNHVPFAEDFVPATPSTSTAMKVAQKAGEAAAASAGGKYERIGAPAAASWAKPSTLLVAAALVAITAAVVTRRR